MTPFSRSLNYTSVNEDWRTEAAALRVGPGDAALVVTGSGDRALDVLALGPARVVAIDVAPAQSALLALKAAALRDLPFDDYAAFLGLAPAGRGWRRTLLARLGPRLDRDAAAWWESPAARALAARGLLYQGRWERFFGGLSVLARLLRPLAVRRLFQLEDLEAQRRFLRRVWDRPWWRWAHHLLLSRPVLRLALGDPAFFPATGPAPGAFIHQRTLAGLRRVLARDSFMASLTLRGRLAPGDLPPYLTRAGCQLIRGRLRRLEVVTADVVEYLERDPAPGPFHCFSLSDVPSYLDQAAFERLLAGVVRCAAPGARFCIRLFLARPSLAAGPWDRLVRDPALERRLAEEDHAFVYDFIAGHVA